MVVVDRPIPTEFADICAELDSMMEANRARRDTEREQRILELRHAASTHAVPADAASADSASADSASADSGQNEPTAWPPPLPDPFPGEVGMVEIPARELTTEIMGGAIQHHGLLLVRGLWSAKECAILRRCVDEALDRSGSGSTERDAWYSPFRPDKGRFGFGLGDQSLSVSDSPRAAFNFCAIYEPMVRSVIEPYLGERPVVRSGKWTLRRISPDIQGHWHQDGRFLGEMRVVNVWSALSACGPGTGAPGLEFLPRAVDILPTIGEDGGESIVINERTIEEYRGDSPIESPVYEPGDTVLFDHRTPHRPGLVPGLTTTRYALESWFFAPSVSPYHPDEPLFLF